MKSDKEFLDGIYKKAANYDLYEADNGKRNRRMNWHTITSFAAVLLVGVLSISLILNNSKSANQDSDQDINKDINQDINQDSNNIELINDLPRIISPFGIDIITVDEDGITIMSEEAKLADAVISGKVTRNFSEDMILYSEILVENCYMGEINQNIIFIKNEVSGETEEFIFAQNEQVLLFILKENSDTYLLTDIYNGKMSYTSYTIEATGDGIYERYDGVRINERDLYSGVFSH